MATAEEKKEEAAPAAKGGGLAGAVTWGLIGLVAGASGFALPQYLSQGHGEAAEPASAHPAAAIESVVFIPFDEIVVNLDEGRLNRYLRIRLTLNVSKQNELMVSGLLEKNKAILKNWLLSHLSDKTMDGIRGAAGQNRLRREIQDHFNTQLFPDGFERIRDVLFEEFNVQ